MSDRQKLLELRNVHVSFGKVTALEGVDFDLYAGEIHGLIGEHTAGKSTLAKVLSGAVRADQGAIFFSGRKVQFLTPKSASEKGIGIVYQDLSILPHLSAVENIFAGRTLRRGIRWFLDHRAMERQAADLLLSLECTFDLQIPMAKLKPANRHMVEFARALIPRPRVLILDELSNKLTPADIRVVYRTVFELRDQGCGIVYISHDMDEIMRLADRVTVLRGGHRQLTAEAKSLDRLRLHELTYSFSVEQLQRVSGNDTPLLHFKRDLQNVIQIFPIGVVLLDEAGAILLYNQAANKLCGLDRGELDRPFLKLLSALSQDDAEVARIVENLAKGKPAKAPALKLQNGKTISIAAAPLPGSNGAGVGCLLAIEDVSFARYMKKFVMENAKVSTVAQLAVGVAHEINNPLFAIQNYLEVIRGRVADPEIEERLTRIEREVTRISEIVSSLLSFSRVVSPPQGIVDMREIIRDAVILLQHTFREKAVSLSLDISEVPLKVQGDENRLIQVILNLASNAADAVLNGGKIDIVARRAADGWVEVLVIDDGCGIMDDVGTRVFDPFFTTKLSRKNTGLGLSICHNILDEHAGAISFNSKPGSGTAFTVRLPPARTE